MPTYRNANRQMCLFHQVKSTQPQTLVSMKDDLANKNNPPNHHYSSCPMSIWHQSNPNTGQCKWPMCSYTGNNLSTGTHHWSGRSMIWQTKRKPLPTPAHPIQQTQSITFPPAQCQPPISNANPSILYQYANPMPINSQYIWPFRSYTGNKNSTGTDCWSPRRMISPLTIGWNYISLSTERPDVLAGIGAGLVVYWQIGFTQGRASLLLRFIFSTFGTNYEALLPPTHYHPSPVSKDNGNVGEEEVESTVMILVRIFGGGWEVIRLPNWCIKWKIWTSTESPDVQ